ncbi:MAG: cation:proton antiporter [Candidatus Abawacabacteria bacterium]|nr:cation:proton antiporter [Candidatus Abawacabacteria bacterium]
MSILVELGIIIGAAAIGGIVGYLFKQPLVLAYLLAGIAIGPFGLGLITDTEFIHVVGEIGIMLMLFLVGIEINIDKIRSLGKKALKVGFAQIFFTGIAGWGIALGFGFSMLASAYIAVALTLSSTAICVKLLSDQKTLSSLYGRMAIGILLVQDFVAVLVLVFLNSLGTHTNDSFILDFSLLLAKGLGLAAIIFIILKKPLLFFYHRIAHSQELLILVSLSWCFGIALAAQAMGFSREMGAFLAGLSLANLPYALEISAKSRIIRDFFITIFFVTLGAGMIFTKLSIIVLPLLALSAFVIIGNPLIVLVIMRLLGFDSRSSFFTGITIAQISEFSFILITLGAKLGHVDQTIVSIISMVAIITISISSYMMKYQQRLYVFCKVLIEKLPRMHKGKDIAELTPSNLFDHIILLGCGSGGHQLLDTLAKGNKQFIVVDHDPEVIDELSQKGINCIFGDVQDEELFTTLNATKADLIISLLPHMEDNLALLHYLKESPEPKKPIYIAAVNTGREGFSLFSKGADYVVVKSSLEANHIKEIHRDLYNLEKNYIEQQEQSERIAMRRMEHAMLHDKEYAEIVHELSKLRLQEIQQKRATKEPQ